MSFYIKLLQVLAILSLTACSQWQQQPTEPANTLDTLANNNSIQQWSVRGKIGLRNETQAHSAYLNWNQCGDDFDIRLSGPLGQGAAHLVGNAEQVHLATSNQQHYSASSAGQLLEQQLGWSLPVEQLRHWLRAIPDPDFAYRANQPNQVLGFSQEGWRLSYPRLTQQDKYQLPARIIAEQAPLKVTLVIKAWLLNPDCPKQTTAP